MSDENTTSTAEGPNRDRDGRRTATRRKVLKATGAAAVAGGVGAAITGSAAAEGIPTPWLDRDGNLLKDPNGEKVILRGVNTVDPYRAARDAPYYKIRVENQIEKATNGTNGWYARIIRIPMQPNDIARQGAGSIAPGEFTQEQLDSYLRKYVDPAVTKCAEVGAYCILDYHRHWPDGPGWDDPALGDEVEMFWDTVAARYGGRSHVLFEVFNEPTEPYAGDDVYDGGPDVTDPESEDTWLKWRDTAQPWVDKIREHASRNVVIVGSPRWSQWTYWAPEHEFEGDNLAYAGHVYTQDNLRPLSTYFGEPSEEVPVFMSEFGWGGPEPQLVGDAETYGPQFADFFDEYDVHWQAWSFDFDWEPGMLNRDYEVANDWGRWVKNRLQEFKDQDVPTTDEGETTAPPTTTTAPPTTEPSTTEPSTTEPPADDPSVQTIAADLSVEQVSTDGTAEATITLSGAPNGVAGFDLSVGVADASVATVTGASYPDGWFSEGVDVAADGSSVSLQAVDGGQNVQAGSTDVELATVALEAQSDGETAVVVSVENLDSDDQGAEIPTTTAAGALTVTGDTDVEPIAENVPQDIDGDGDYEDVNGNGEFESDDVVLFFNSYDEDVVTDHAAAYDFNDSGDVDFDDIVQLFNRL